MKPGQTFTWEDGPFKLMQTPPARWPERSKDDVVNLATLMALIHNCWIRALNSVYLAAPHVPPREYKNFVGYALQVHFAIKAHHDEEEAFAFPLVEEMTGAEGIMKANVEQHLAFEHGFEAYAQYLSTLIQENKTDSFSGTNLCRLIDGFREPLQTHLEDEIQTLLELDKYPDLDIPLLQKRAHEQTLAHMKMVQLRDNMPVLLLNHDRTYEEGRHGMFPPLPGPMSVILRKFAMCWHWGWWKFATCDTNQMPKELPYVSEK